TGAAARPRRRHGRTGGGPAGAVAAVPVQRLCRGRPGVLADGRRLLLPRGPRALTMTATALHELTGHLLERLHQVREDLGLGPAADDPHVPFGDLLDSMGLVEFLVLVAEDCGVEPADVERCVGRRFGTVAELAAAMHAAGILPGGRRPAPKPAKTPERAWSRQTGQVPCWLGATVACLPRAAQPAARLDEAVHRPAGWLEGAAGIRARRGGTGGGRSGSAGDGR